MKRIEVTSEIEIQFSVALGCFREFFASQKKFEKFVLKMAEKFNGKERGLRKMLFSNRLVFGKKSLIALSVEQTLWFYGLQKLYEVYPGKLDNAFFITHSMNEVFRRKTGRYPHQKAGLLFWTILPTVKTWRKNKLKLPPELFTRMQKAASEEFEELKNLAADGPFDAKEVYSSAIVRVYEKVTRETPKVIEAYVNKVSQLKSALLPKSRQLKLEF